MVKNLKQQIKEMEDKIRQESAPAVQAKELVSFDSWFHQKQSKIAKCHRKEIIMADFKARGVGEQATMEEFDKALELYGVKL